MGFLGRLLGRKNQSAAGPPPSLPQLSSFAPTGGDMTELLGGAPPNLTPPPAPHPVNNRDRVLRELLDGYVFVVTRDKPTETRSYIAQAGTLLALVTMRDAQNRLLLPVFSSLEALQRSLTEPAGYTRLLTRDFLEISSQHPFDAIVVDAGSKDGFYLSPGDAEYMRSGLVPIGGPGNRVIATEAVKEIMGAPAVPPPQALIEAVRSFCGAIPEIAEGLIYWHIVGQTEPCYAVALRLDKSNPCIEEHIYSRGEEFFAKLGDLRFDVSIVDQPKADHVRKHVQPVFSR